MVFAVAGCKRSAPDPHRTPIAFHWLPASRTPVTAAASPEITLQDACRAQSRHLQSRAIIKAGHLSTCILKFIPLSGALALERVLLETLRPTRRRHCQHPFMNWPRQHHKDTVGRTAYALATLEH